MKNTTQQLVFHVFGEQFVIPLEVLLGSFDETLTTAWAAADSEGIVCIYSHRPTADYDRGDWITTPSNDYLVWGTVDFNEDEFLNDTWADTLVEIKLQ